MALLTSGPDRVTPQTAGPVADVANLAQDATVADYYQEFRRQQPELAALMERDLAFDTFQAEIDTAAAFDGEAAPFETPAERDFIHGLMDRMEDDALFEDM
eukprot:gnl/Ergobibamus_cyprinoides/3622.p2 GENE.gnl/Ergobibamus_cyprinoides/3622~~gnl/Ergobibamus_cyprinoides/3622.p2  ORF type:complete len:118 (+),score=26.38 gnl/Ergobibamus_cyprinoides/3622:52-354(+)